MTQAILMLPVLLPMTAGVLGLLAWGRLWAHRALGVGATLGMLAVGIWLLGATADGSVLATYVGAWGPGNPALAGAEIPPVGIVIVVDHLSALLVTLTGAAGFVVVLYGWGSLDNVRESRGFHPLAQSLLAGVSGAFTTGDLFNMFVWFEVMLISSFVLLALGGGRQQLQAALKYVTLNLLSSVLFLTAIGLLYGLTGTLNIAELALRVPEVEHQKLLTAVAVLFLCAFGIKAGMVPFFFWVPAAYVAPPAAVTALFAALLTKVGVYAIIRVFGLLFMHDADEMTVLYTVLLWLSGITMVLGVLGAASQPVVRRILAFHSVSQVGYMLMGPAVAGLALAAALRSDGAEAEAARTAATIVLAGSVLFMIHHAVVKMSLFMVAGLMIAKCGSDDLRRVAGLYRRDWLLGLLFMAVALSLAGIPALSGFWAKLALVRGGLAAGELGIVIVSLCVGVLTLFSMMKIWAQGFWREPEEVAGEGQSLTRGDAAEPSRWPLLLMQGPLALMAAAAVLMGVFAGPVYRACELAASGVVDTTGYIQGVLGESAPPQAGTDAPEDPEQ